uniref:Metalloendopeptidase n=1 Tax=Panagrellus redivivus TaxID=6233 RepID=A0A7E4V561_PANRE
MLILARTTMKIVILCIALALPTIHAIDRHRRQVVSNGNETRLRKGTVIPYYIVGYEKLRNHSLGRELINNVQNAFKTLERLTCLSFVDKSQEIFPRKLLIFYAQRFILIEYSKKPVHCSATLGRRRRDHTVITVSEKCYKDQLTIIHEILHVLGIIHIQMRKDRDHYIYVNEGALTEDTKSSFEIVPDAKTFGVPYNPGSVMHYVPKPLMRKSDVFIGSIQSVTKNSFSNNRLTFTDIKLINLAYQCHAKCSQEDIERCSNHHGIPDSRNCATCHCPDAFQGPTCTDRAELKVNNQVCGATLQATEDWTTLSKSFDTSGACAWHIKSPMGTLLEIEVKNIQTTPTNTKHSKKCTTCEHFCMNGYLEIQNNADIQIAGLRFCCNKDITESIITDKNILPIIASFSKPFGFELQYRYIID